MTDLATLQGTRLGLAVVGRLALKHRISVNYRPSSRGGTGVVVLLPRHLIAQEPRENHPAPAHRAAPAAAPATPPHTPASPAPASPAPPAPAPAPPASPTPPLAPEPTPVQPSPAPAPAENHLVVRPRESGRKVVGPAANSTPGGLPVRTPGRTMAESDRERGRHRGSPAPAAPGDPRGNTPRTSPPRSAGQQFGAFRRGTKPTGTTGHPEVGAGEPEGRSQGPEGGTVPPTTAP